VVSPQSYDILSSNQITSPSVMRSSTEILLMRMWRRKCDVDENQEPKQSSSVL
jgi:hypothetical protein